MTSLASSFELETSDDPSDAGWHCRARDAAQRPEGPITVYFQCLSLQLRGGQCLRLCLTHTLSKCMLNE